MKIGIYTGQTAPSAGGAHTLIETIKNDILNIKCAHDIVFFYESVGLASSRIDNGIRYVTIPIPDTKRILFRLRRKFLTLFGKFPENRRVDAALHRENIDLVWLLGPNCVDINLPYIFTVWDLGHRTQPSFPEVSSEGWRWDSRENTYQKMLYRASYVITGNETGKKELLDNYPMNPDKIRIVPFPIPLFCFEPMQIPEKIDGIESPFIFYPAQFWAHKNHINLVESIRYLRDQKKILMNCYFVGSDKGNAGYIERKIKEYGLEGLVRNLGFVETGTLRYLYKNAVAMTFMSLLGPNNLPPLEAAALECPVIISNLPGHIEEMEGAAMTVDATDPIKIAEAIYLFQTDYAMRDNFIKKGKALADKYRNYSYYGKMFEIFDEFQLLRKTWA